MSRHAPNACFSLLAALCLTLAAPACDSSSDEEAKPDAGEQLAPGEAENGESQDADANASGSEGDSPDAGESNPTDAAEDGQDDTGDEAAYTGCDLMEFAPENRGQGQEYADLFLSVPEGYSPYLQYVKEQTWFEGGTPDDPNSIWRADALSIARWWFDGETPAWAPGSYPITGVDLDPLNCELCVDLNTSNLDAAVPTNEIFYPEEAAVTVIEVELAWRGVLRGTVSGRFREANGTRTWCVNELPFETTLDVPCNGIEDCPTEATACDFATTQAAYKTCMAASDE